jgi:hypothetical protein
MNRTSAHHPIRRGVAVAALTLGSVFATLGVSSAAHADGITTVADADYNCAAQTVSVLPSSNEPVYGNYSVWAYAQVYDWNYGGWISESNWSVVDGITTHVFYGITQPYTHAYVHYAVFVDGAWRYWNEWVQIDNDLDNLFCNLGF